MSPWMAWSVIAFGAAVTVLAGFMFGAALASGRRYRRARWARRELLADMFDQASQWRR